MDISLLKNTILFHNMNNDEINSAIKGLSAIPKHYRKNTIIFHAGNTYEYTGLILSGSVTVESNDMWGNRTILSHIGKGQLFAETYALLNNEPMLVDVRANETCDILLLRIGGLINISNDHLEWKQKLIHNLLIISAHKNLMLSGRSFHTSPKTIRGRVMAYLNSVSIKKKNRTFDIPFDRQQLSDYLNIERTALSKELGRMQKEGIITVKKNHFEIL